MSNGNYAPATSGPLGYYPPPPMTVPPPNQRETVGSALDWQQDRIVGLHNAISELEMRLSTVLEGIPADSIADKSLAPNPTSVLQRIALGSVGIETAAKRLATLLARLQL